MGIKLRKKKTAWVKIFYSSNTHTERKVGETRVEKMGEKGRQGRIQPEGEDERERETLHY